VYVTVAGDDGNALLQLHLDDGARRRVLARQADAGAPLVADGRLLVQTETGLRCLD
jgi:hypothetical protein